jgi:hypothetical protein
VRISAAGAGQVTIGLRIPLGVLYAFKAVPIEISLDIVPGLNLFPDTAPLVMGGIAVRYRF